MNQDILIRNSEFNIGKVDNSTINTQNSTLRTAHRLPFIAILTLQKLLCVFMALPLCVSMYFYDEQGNETEMVVMKTGSDTSGIIMNKWLINQIDIKCRH